MDNTIIERRIIEKSGRERLRHSTNYDGIVGKGLQGIKRRVD